MIHNPVQIVKKVQLALVVLFVALFGVEMINTSVSAGPQAPARIAELETSTQAKSAMVRLKSLNYNRIKDAGLRDSVRRTVIAVKALADNTSPEREAALVANFKRTLGKLKLKGKPTGAGEKCIAEAEDCEKGGIWIHCDLKFVMCLTAEYEEINKPGKLPE